MPNTIECPRCKKEVLLVPHPERPGRMIGICDCNPLGPVYETNGEPEADPESKKANVEVTE